MKLKEYIDRLIMLEEHVKKNGSDPSAIEISNIKSKEPTIKIAKSQEGKIEKIFLA